MQNFDYQTPTRLIFGRGVVDEKLPRVMAQFDYLLSFATAAAENKYICPDVNDSLVIDIRQSRHPVIEQQLPVGEGYVANDVLLDNNGQQIIIITGPNMAGKSTLNAPEGMQLSFFQLDDPVLEQIRDELTRLDINSLTPLEALNKLNDIKKLVGGK